ncbi:MAG: hypothetical protein LBN42_01830 [Oscillospiraceae bacterium]|jgi:hypothetical protein|nr:hypothetical protein [Oscillospiraceae bacterium]
MITEIIKLEGVPPKPNMYPIKTLKAYTVPNAPVVSDKTDMPVAELTGIPVPDVSASSEVINITPNAPTVGADVSDISALYPPLPNTYAITDLDTITHKSRATVGQQALSGTAVQFLCSAALIGGLYALQYGAPDTFAAVAEVVAKCFGL